MKKRWIALGALALGLVAASPVAAGGATVDRLEDVGSVVVVALPDNFPIASISRADCDFVERVEHPDGSAIETQVCRLSDAPVMIPEFQGSAPATAFHNGGGPCEWASDYWFNLTGEDVYASSFSYVVTPSGMVHARSMYPAQDLVCD